MTAPACHPLREDECKLALYHLALQGITVGQAASQHQRFRDLVLQPLDTEDDDTGPPAALARRARVAAVDSDGTRLLGEGVIWDVIRNIP